MIYTTCKYAPMEIFAGFGEETGRLDPNPASFTCADGCAHPNLCGYVKAVIEEVHDKGIRRMVLVDCCDATRRMYDVLKDYEDLDFIYLLPLPHKTGPDEISLTAEALKMMIDEYIRFTGKVFDVNKAIEDYCVRQRTSFLQPSGEYIIMNGAHGGKELLDNTQKIFGDIPVVDCTCSGNRVLTADAGELRQGGAGAVSGLDTEADSGTGGVRDTAGGETGGSEVPPHNKENIAVFLNWYAGALIRQGTPCMRMWDTGARNEPGNGPGAGEASVRREGKSGRFGKWVFDAGEWNDAGSRNDDDSRNDAGPRMLGMIYHTMKFCDFYGFEYMMEREMYGLPILKIETDTTPQSSGQLKTRLEAFREELGLQEEVMRIQTEGPVYAAGIDSGSSSTDAVIMDAEMNILGRAVVPTGAGASNGAHMALSMVLEEAGLKPEDITVAVTTGYGRNNIDADAKVVTEITCHARGAAFLAPGTRTVIDIGGQDSKVILIDEKGSVQNFIMNDKCAAGTGRFLEMQARTMQISMDDMSRLGIEWKNEVSISSMCTVFAESEVVSLIADNTPVPDIIHGLNNAIAQKTIGLVKRLGGQETYLLTGGVAQNKGVVKCLEKKLGAPVFVSPDSQLCGAIGAALIALESVES